MAARHVPGTALHETRTYGVVTRLRRPSVRPQEAPTSRPVHSEPVSPASAPRRCCAQRGCMHARRRRRVVRRLAGRAAARPRALPERSLGARVGSSRAEHQGAGRVRVRLVVVRRRHSSRSADHLGCSRRLGAGARCSASTPPTARCPDPTSSATRQGRWSTTCRSCGLDLADPRRPSGMVPARACVRASSIIRPDTAPTRSVRSRGSRSWTSLALPWTSLVKTASRPVSSPSTRHDSVASPGRRWRLLWARCGSGPARSRPGRPSSSPTPGAESVGEIADTHPPGRARRGAAHPDAVRASRPFRSRPV